MINKFPELKNKLKKSSFKYIFYYYLNHRWLKLPFNKISFRIGNSIFKIPIINQIGLNNLKPDEKWMFNILDLLLPRIKDATFIDVGVNIGQTLLKVKSICPNMKYMGFEPNVKCVDYVNELIKINSIQNATIIPVGLSNKTQLLDLIHFDESGVDASATLIAGFRTTCKKRTSVMVVTPDDIDLFSKDRIGCIKIDVEGGELEVLEGLHKYIIENKPIILCEILPVYNKDNDLRITRQRKLLNLLESANYEFFRINIENSSLQRIEDIGIHSNMNNSNYIFIPKDSMKLFRGLRLDII